MGTAKRSIPEPPAATSATPSAPTDSSKPRQNIRNGERHETLCPLQQPARSHLAPALVAALLLAGAQEGLSAQAAAAQATAGRDAHDRISAVAARQAAVTAGADLAERDAHLRAAEATASAAAPREIRRRCCARRIARTPARPPAAWRGCPTMS